MNGTNKVSVADYITNQIMMSDLSQKDIAAMLGYDKPNNITMIKQGKTKLPINKVPAMATALGVDPIHLMRLVMTEYAPEIWEVLNGLLGHSLISDGDREILNIVHANGHGVDIYPVTDEEKLELASLALKWYKRESGALETSRKRVERKKTA